MTNPQLIAFVERKLAEHGVKKVIPPETSLQKEYCATVREMKIHREMEAAEVRVSKEMESFKPPDGLHREVASEFERDAALSWKEAINTLATNTRKKNE